MKKNRTFFVPTIDNLKYITYVCNVVIYHFKHFTIMKAVVKLKAIAKYIEPVKGMDVDAIANMLDVTATITKRNTSIDVSLRDCLSQIASAKARVDALAPVTDSAQVAEMQEYKELFKELQDARVLAVDCIDAVKEKALRENQQWVKVRNFVEAYSAPAEEKAKANADFIKIQEEKALSEKVAGWLTQLHALNDFSKSEKDLRLMQDDVFSAYLASQVTRVEREKQETEEKAKAEELARLQAEKQARCNIRHQRIDAYFAFAPIGVSFDFMNASDDEFEAYLLQAKTAFEADKAEKAKALAEERERQIKRDNLRQSRATVLRPFQAFADTSNDLADMTDEQFSKLLTDAKNAFEADKAKKEAEAKAIAEKEAELAKERAKIAEEKARIEAEARAKAEAEAQAKAEKERLEKAGDGEKLLAFAEVLKKALNELPDASVLQTQKAFDVANQIDSRLSAIIDYITKEYSA